jgi:7-alpha-hydroxysteroid dehydrogenase
MDLSGKVAIVTGASAGIGRAYALALAGAGATVVAAARTLGTAGEDPPARNTLAEVVQAARGLPGRIYAQPCDMEVEADVARMVQQAAANFGRLDILVNNAAIYPRYDAFEADAEQFDRYMRINVRGPYLAIRSAAPLMIRQGAGSIVNMTSASAQPVPRDHPAHERLMVYGLTKAALNRLTSYMAEELRPHGVAVNGLSPGAVLTDAWAVADLAGMEAAKASGWGKPPTPEVMGPALVHLAGQTAETLTGQILHTDEFGKSWP